METPRKWLSKYWCAMPDCLFDNRNISRQDRFPFMKTVLFHPYPEKIKNNTERQNWLQLVRRPSNHEPKRHHRVCSLYLVDGKPIK